MNLVSRLKQGVAVVFGLALTVVMFPVILATTSFLLIMGFMGALFGAYKLRQLAREVERTGEFSVKHGSVSKKQTIEGSYYVVHPTS